MKRSIGPQFLPLYRIFPPLSYTSPSSQYQKTDKLWQLPYSCSVQPAQKCILLTLNVSYFVRLLGFSLITLLYVSPLTANCKYQAELFLEKDKNKALHGLSIHNVSTIKIDDCLAHCLKNCLCLSFQICDDALQCQLCSSNKYISPWLLKQSKGCANYNFGNQEEKEVKLQ